MKVKHKPHKGAAKRFKVTKSGKVLHRSIKLRHLRTVKGKRTLRRLKQLKRVNVSFEGKIKKLLAIK